AVVPPARAGRERARHGPVSGARRPDLARGRAGAVARSPRARRGEDLVDGGRERRRDRAHGAASGVPGAPTLDPVAGRRRPRVDLSLVLRRAVLHRRTARLVAREDAPAAFAGIHLPRGLGLDRRREPDGGRAGDVGERTGAGAAAGRAVSVRIPLRAEKFATRG